MAESLEVQALRKISSEVEESQMTVVLSTQCIKAQMHLANKLKKQAERNKEACSFLSNGNMKLQFEITQAEQEIKSLLTAQETIRMANVEFKKHSLLAQQKKIEVLERVETGEKKYEKLWLESKARFECLLHVQKLLKAKDEIRDIQQQIAKLENEETKLIEQIDKKKETCFHLDRKRVIELADFMVNEMPKTIKLIQEKTAAIKDLTDESVNFEFKSMEIDTPKKLITSKVTKDDLKAVNNKSSVENVNDSSFLMQKLQQGFLNFDALNVNLDQVFEISPEKNNTNVISLMEVDESTANKTIENTEEYISLFFHEPSNAYGENKNQSYSKMKLINILEDIRVDKNEVQKMVANVNPSALQKVDVISVEDKNVDQEGEVLKNKEKKIVEREEIEKTDLTGSIEDKLLIPPTQFLDLTLEVQSSQEKHSTKKVSFDLPNTKTDVIMTNVDKLESAKEIEANVTQNGQLNVSTVSDDGLARIKDMMKKKHDLDLSPQFVYAKNIITPYNLQKSEGEVVTSKFFEHDQKISNPEDVDMENVLLNNDDQAMEVNEVATIQNEFDNKSANPSTKKHKISEAEMDVDADHASSPIKQKISKKEKSDKPVKGLLFSHGAQTIPDSLDISINTTGFEEGDFPHYIDSSLLLSPRADIPMSSSNNPEVVSQDVPNFLSGLRKTGLSFFGCAQSSEPKPDTSAQNPGTSGFNFNFGGEQKKTRGGLFSMFQ